MVFLHVPVEADEAALKTGVEVTIELIRALVQSGRMKKLATDPESIGADMMYESIDGMRG